MTSAQTRWKSGLRTSTQFLSRRKGACAVAVATAVALTSAFYPYSFGVSEKGSSMPYFTVNVVPIIETVDVVGRIEPLSTNSISAPFDAVIIKYLVSNGQQVRKDQPLVELDTADLEIKLRDARSAYLKAESSFKELSNWALGPEVMQAKRRLLTAQLMLDELKARRSEAERLYSRGIVPKLELDTYAQQEQTQRLELESAQSEVASTLKRGDQSSVSVARLELENAKTKLKSLELLTQQSVLASPFNGVVSKPSSTSDKIVGSEVGSGAYVIRGQRLFDVVDAEQLVARAFVDEIDINRIQVNQRVTITGFGEPMFGRVQDVASRAMTQTGDGTAKFSVSIELPPLSEEQRQRTRIGMRAKLSVVTYENPKAIVVPPSALSQIDDHDIVRIVDGSTSKSIPVTLGVSTEEGVEVLSGLKPGMKVRFAP